MSWFPDCRTHEFYNQKYLNDNDKEFVKGFDFAVEQVLNLVDNNADVYPDFEEILNRDKAVINVDKEKIVHEAIEQWLESERDMLITSMIDNMGEEEFESIKEKVDSGK